MAPPQVIIPSSASAQRQRFAAAYSILEQEISQQAFPGAAFGVLVRGRGAGAGWNWRLYLRATNRGCERFHRIRPGQRHQGDRDHFHGHAAVPEGAALTRPISGADFSRLRPRRKYRRRATPGDATHVAGAHFRIGRLRSPLRERSRPRGAARCLPPPATRSRAWKPCRVLRSWLHPARARPGSHCRREPGRLLCARGFPPTGHDQHLLSATGWLAIRHPTDRRGLDLPPTASSKERSRMKTVLSLGEQAAMPVFSPMHWIRCFTRNACSAGNSSRRRRFDSSPPAPSRQTAPGHWDGIHPPSLPPPAGSSAATQPAISATREPPSGSTLSAS